jgi:hypothetical protein
MSAEKAHLARVPELSPQYCQLRSESKYYGNWYGNRLAVTICVTTKTLLSPNSKKRRFV